MASKAAHEPCWDDALVATIDDSSAVLNRIAKLPTMWAASGYACMSKEISASTFELLDRICKGEQVQSQKAIPFSPMLVTKGNFAEGILRERLRL